MKLQSQSHGNVELVTLPRQLVMANAQETRAAIRELIDNGRTRVVLDLEPVEFVDSSGLSVLVSALKALRPVAGQAVLLSPQDDVRGFREQARSYTA